MPGAFDSLFCPEGTPCFVLRGGFLYTVIVLGEGFLLPSSRVPGRMVLDENDTCKTLSLYRAKMGLSITTVSNSRSFYASAPPKMVRMDSFPKTVIQLNSYRNARITTIFEFVDKLDFTYFV